MTRRFVHILCSLTLAGQLSLPALAASQPELNFKIYSPDGTPSTEQPKEQSGGKADDKSGSDSMWSSDPAAGAAQAPTSDPVAGTAQTPTADPAASTTAETTSTSVTTDAAPAAAGDASEGASTGSDSAGQAGSKSGKLLQGYIRVVPSGTKIPIIMDTAVDSDTSQEGDEFAARTGEDLNIDGTTVIPAGSVIKGRIAQLNSPRNLGRSGSVALKFDTVTTPDNRQIPLVANLVARGGVVHARRGMKDIAMDTGTMALPMALGLGIGLLAGSAKSGSSGKSHIGKGTGAVIGAGVGAAIGIAILCIKKGKKVDVRPGDELKIELAEDLRMPM